MNTDTLCIKSITEAANLTAQQNIDADIILPDYYDSIGKILKSEITPVIEAVTTSGDKISIAGIAKFSLIYTGENNKMYCYENEYRYTKVFQTQYAESYMSSKVNQTVFSLNCRAIAAKRIELRSVLQIGVNIKCSTEKVLISSVDNESVISKNESIDYVSRINTVSRSFSLTGSYPLSDFNEIPDIIIRKDSKIKISETKTIHNKAYIKGLAETEIIFYSDKSGNISSTVISLPVSEIIDIFGAEDDDICSININDIFTETIIRNTEAENKTLDVRLDISIQAEVNRTVTANMVCDLFSVKNEMSTVKDTVELITSCKRVTKNENIVFETDVYDESKFSVVDSWVSNMRISSEKHGNKYNLLVTALFNALTKNEYGTLSVITREHTFETQLIAEQEETTLTNHCERVLSINALQTQPGKIRFSADILFEADICAIRKASCFTDIKILEESQYDATSRFTIYFAKKNEDIWSVAKENRTSLDSLKEINNLTGDIITEDRMLLLPSF